MPDTPRTLIRGGTLIDGTASPRRPADLLIEAGRVVEVLPPSTSTPARVDSVSVIDARGRIVCPGFIDIHSHGDLVLASPPGPQLRLLEGRLSQGITTQIVGNCGLGVFPRTDAGESMLRSIVSWMDPSAAAEAGARSSWPWDDIAGYLEHLETQGVWVNAGALQPHGPLRIAVSGIAPSRDGPAGASAARRMEHLLEAALDAGAFGISTGLIYPPGIFTPTDELVSLARVVRRAAGAEGIVASHIRGSSETLLPAVEELIRIGRESGARVQHSHHEAVGRDHWSKIERTLGMEEAARGEGVAMAFDMFPYTAAATMMLAIFPPWSLEGGAQRLLERLADPSTRGAIRDAIENTTPAWPPWIAGGWPHNLVKAVGWDQIRIGSVVSEANRVVEGMSLVELGRLRGTAPLDAIADLMIEEQGRVSQVVHEVSGDADHEDWIEALLRHPSGCVCTDADDFGRGKPHPASWGAFPRVLGRYARERGVLTLESAVHKLSGAPAAILGLRDRGVLSKGACADVVVFDAATVGSSASFERPRSAPTGIEWVLVNGSIVAGPGGTVVSGGDGPAGMVLRRRV